MAPPGERTTEEITLPRAPGRPAVLIVDDDADTRASLGEVFEEADYQVITVEDGLKAFEYLDHQPPPDLVVLDLWMPVMDGWTLANQVVNGRLPNVPILVVTASSAQFGYPVPSRYVLRKPINPDRMLGLGQELIGQRDRV
jgi:CheY-like chemotaxis protein